MVNENTGSKITQGRVLWLDPNKANNVMVDPEDLCIKVEFNTTRKGRSIIFSGDRILNTDTKNASVGFIEGSKVSNSTLPSLTTRYTDAISLDVINTSSDNVDDFESLGIESIDIDFDTANTPLIKIKFIDVRGNAILTQGNMSKYRMFFELPYPIFSLKVKGFYGGTVNYCLHMQRWNASFNSETGNFEIQADFMGYTYALLTDLLFGLIRASVRTAQGQEKLIAKQGEYGQNSNLIISIDDMLSKFVELNNSFEKISSEDNSAAQLQSYDGINTSIDSIRLALSIFSSEIYDGITPTNTYFRSKDGVVLCVPATPESDTKYENALKKYQETIKPLIAEANIKIGDDNKKLKEVDLNNIVKITKITKAEIKSAKNTDYVIQKSSAIGGKYTNDDISMGFVKDLLKVIGTLDTSVATDNTEMNIYNLRRVYNHLDDISKKIADTKTSTETEFSKKLADTASDTIGFDPTVRNIFRVLSINAEIFLEVLKDVSVAAQTDETGKRAIEFNKVTKQLNINEADVINVDKKTIYPWPEYRQEKIGEGYVESWLGKAPGVVGNNINEVVFTDEMHKELINVAKFDIELEKQIEAGLDVDSSPTEVKDPWYPLGVADTPINPLMTQNPYIEAATPLKVDEIKRLVLLRAFYLLDISAFNNKIDSNNNGALLKYLGNFEAENLVAACRALGPHGQTLLATMINESTTKELNDYINSPTYGIVTVNGLVGSLKITNPNDTPKKPIKKPIMLRVNEVGEEIKTPPGEKSKFYYKYTYIRNRETNAAYIPINTGFDGNQFYSGGNFKTIGALKALSNNILFVSSPKNINGFNKFTYYDDGSLHVKLYELNEYISKTMAPGFGSSVIEAYKATLNNQTSIKVDSANDALVKYVLNPNDTLKGVEPLSGNYSALELKTLDYNKTLTDFNYYMGEPMWKSGSNGILIDSSLLAFFTEYNEKGFEYSENGIKKDRNSSYPSVGTYLSYQIDEKLHEDGVFRENNNDGNIFYKPNLKNMYTGYGTNINKVRDTWIKQGSYLKQKGLLSLIISGKNKGYLPFIEFGTSGPTDPTKNNTNEGNFAVSLFGSYFYYLQKHDEVKALLFLHTIPWQGVKTFNVSGLIEPKEINEFLMLDKHKDWSYKVPETNKNYTRVDSIRSLFQGNGAFIHAPKAWVLFIGAMLWRYEYAKENGKKDPILYYDNNGGDYTGIYKNNTNSKTPDINQFLYMSTSGAKDLNPWGLFIGNFNTGYGKESSTYTPIDKTLLNLPKQVREEFINYFKNWVNDENGFKFIQNELELHKGNFDFNIWKYKYKTVIDAIQKVNDKGRESISISKLNELFGENVVKNYQLIVGEKNEIVNRNFESIGIKYNLNTIFRPGTTVMDNIVSLLTQPTIIQNVNPNIWNYDFYQDVERPADKIPALNELAAEMGYEKKDYASKSIRVRADKLEIYLKGFYEQLIDLNDAYQKEVVPDANDEIEQEVFGTSDDTTIKLLIYRTLSSINDKWLNGSENKTPFTQCGAATVNETDLKYAKKYRTGATEASLIDTFRFVDRAFADIGDKFYLNINSVSELIRGNYNQSYFDVVNKILSDNNFNFIPLPTFINFNDITELESIFTPYNYNNPVTFEGTGPSFVCVYVGQTSTNLDLGTDSVYPDDGLSFTTDPSGTSLIFSKETADFKTSISGDTLDGNVPVFAVNYGQQNQNYFKSVKLDQREFVETMESLQVIESISQTGDKSKPTYAGNNLFNVYQTRSYSAEVEMMGSAMIQPMMYFQLNNIPMFRGAYLIYKVTHNIRPNTMTTTFKGNRVKKTKTPLIDKATMFMNLVGATGNGAQITSNRGQSAGYYAPIVKTIIDNGGTNGNVVSGNITVKEIPFEKLKGVGDPFGKKSEKSENLLLSEAVEPLINMLNDWTDWMSTNGFSGKGSGNKKEYTYITSIFRDFAKQEQIKRDKTAEGKPNDAATPGTSPHGWGMAVDLQFFKKNGETINNTSNTPASFKIDTNPAIKWLYDNSYMYGWVLPYKLRDGSSLDEHWHFEYHGTSAKCMVEANPTVYGYKMNTSGTVKSFVKNPKDSSGKEAVYTGCDYKYIKQGDGTENGGEKSTQLSNAASSQNQITVKNYFKGKGLSKEAVAGIMGNIQKESQFNPNALNPKDSNGLPSYGLIQWNANTASKSDFGTTLESQLAYLVIFGGRYKKYLNKLIEETKTGQKADASKAAYWFAYYVEVCGGCRGTYEEFLQKNNNKTGERAAFANDFYKRFNTVGDSLKW